jgi:hypothetical protein
LYEWFDEWLDRRTYVWMGGEADGCRWKEKMAEELRRLADA